MLGIVNFGRCENGKFLEKTFFSCSPFFNAFRALEEAYARPARTLLALAIIALALAVIAIVLVIIALPAAPMPSALPPHCPPTLKILATPMFVTEMIFKMFFYFLILAFEQMSYYPFFSLL